LTPREGHETQADWPRFRVEHNAEEGDREVTMLAAARNLRFRAAGGTCVRDSYVTTTGAQYTELACLLTGRHTSAVVVGASPPGVWAKMGPLIERAIAAFRG
jgi:acyl-CoA reductase-like NAD-dependent aldehyde dehydrogenase